MSDINKQPSIRSGKRAELTIDTFGGHAVPSRAPMIQRSDTQVAVSPQDGVRGAAHDPGRCRLPDQVCETRGSTAEPRPLKHPLCGLCDEFGTGAEPLGSGVAGCWTGATRIPLRAGARLFESGSTGNAVYVVQTGLVKETMPGPEGNECIVRLAARNHVVGLCALLGMPHRHSAYVMHPGTACRIPVEQLERMQAANPAVTERLQRDWQQAVDDADRILADLGQGSARARLARALLYLRSVAAPDEPLHLRRNDLAQLLAISPVSVARVLGEFRREGLIEEKQRRCTAMDTARLLQLSTGQT